MTSLDAIMREVRQAPRANSARPRRWRDLYPAYEALRQKDYSCSRAVDWLVSRGHVPAKDKDRATNAFKILTTRRNKAKSTR